MQGNDLKKNRGGIYLLLHILLLVYAVACIFSKKAAGSLFGTRQFFLYYGLNLLLLGVYAVGWQQVLKRIPLTAAYAHKSITVIWGVVFGVLLFHETLNFRQIAGVLLVICGIVLFSISDREAGHAGK
ncbi:MAG: EamA family transporter [Clostridia bacterium]|nr:EamA family transporter [Clostridia bacterium]